MSGGAAASAAGAVAGAAIAAAVLALLVAVNAERIGRLLRLMDAPDDSGRKRHEKPTPMVGGIALMLGVLPAMLFVLFRAPPADHGAGLWFLVVVVAMFLMGTLDDRLRLSALVRLLAAAVLVLVAATIEPTLAIHSLLFAGQRAPTLLPGFWGIGFTLLCFVGLLNAVNMTDGKNGMAIGQAILWAIVLLFRAPPSIAPVVAAALGVLLVLLPFNMRGRLFLGDGGSYGLAALFGLVAVVLWNSAGAGMEPGTALRSDDLALIFAVPVFDTLRLIAFRLAHGQSPFTPGQNHLHHYLDARWGWPRPLVLVLALVALPNGAAIFWPGTGLFWLAVTFFLYAALLLAAHRPWRSAG